MRSIWAGAISFGMVVIPVKLYAATEQRDVAFRQVHREDGGRVQFRRFCSVDGQEVAYSDVAKGYELATGDVVVLTDDDLQELPLATAKRIDVLHFSPAGQLDPILANKAYYLEPEPAGVRAYALFRDALERSGRVAVAKVAIRQREALAALRVREGVLVLETLLWPDEVRAPDFKFLDENVDVRSQELKMAASLIDTMTEDFDPSLYKDTYREALEALVQAKIEGNEVVRPAGQAAPAGKAGGPADLAETLRASVEAAKASRAKPAEQAQPMSPSRRPRPPSPAGPRPRARRRRHDNRSGISLSRTGRGGSCKLGENEQVYLAETPRSVHEDRDLVLCVHGMSGAATNWTDLMAELAPDFDCAAVDLPGSGYSPPPAKRSGYSVRALAATVIRLIETLDRGPVHLVGNSMGGAVSIRVAAARPDLVKTLTLVSPVLPDRRPHRATLHFPVLALPFIGRAAGAVLGHGAGRRTAWPGFTARATTTPPCCTLTGSRRRWPCCAGAMNSATARPRWWAPRERWSARRSACGRSRSGGRPSRSPPRPWCCSAATTGW